MRKWDMLDLQLLKSILDYNKDTGLFTWKVATGNASVGSLAGSKSPSTGYIYIGINGKTYEAHRLALLYIDGVVKNKYVDHIDGIKDNNTYTNLRWCTMSDNQKNRCRSKNNTSGTTGVSWDKKRKMWIAKIKVNYKTIYLGGFEEFHKAVDARKNAEVLYGFHDNHDKTLQKGDFGL